MRQGLLKGFAGEASCDSQQRLGASSRPRTNGQSANQRARLTGRLVRFRSSLLSFLTTIPPVS